MDSKPVLKDRVVVVTGSGRGIGASIADAVARCGAHVLVNDVDEGAIKDTVDHIHEVGGEASGEVADISDPRQAAALIEGCVKRFGRIDGLVNNAGLFAMDRIEDISDESVRSLVDVNVCGTIYLTVHAAQHMLRQGSGSIVNVTSGAHAGMPMMGVYSATKGAVASFTLTCALEFEASGVRCNAISPIAATRMTAAARSFFESQGVSTQGPAISPASNAPLVVYLLSDASQHVNGQLVRIAGGELSTMTHASIWLPSLKRQEWTFDAIVEAFETDLKSRLFPPGLHGTVPAFELQ